MLRQIQNKRMVFSSSNLITSYACRINIKISIDFTISYRIFTFKWQICYYKTNNLHHVIKRLTTYYSHHYNYPTTFSSKCVYFNLIFANFIFWIQYFHCLLHQVLMYRHLLHSTVTCCNE